MSAGDRRGRSRGWWWKLPLLFVVFSVLQVLTLRFVDPIGSPFMLACWWMRHGPVTPGFASTTTSAACAASLPTLPLAVVASEDQNFATHHGFDFNAIEKAQAQRKNDCACGTARHTVKRLRGASTISQQTAKNLFLWQGTGPTRWLRKGLEVWYTALIETLWPKRRILEMYECR